MRNSKGFTLIELLVTIALMLSLLGVAIVSFINVSDRKKHESYEQVKAQIETAAELYFSTNTYLFEGLSEDAKGIISVGKLVREDYLNRVVNPVTGKPVTYCSYVEVTKKGNHFNKKFVESDNDQKNCDTDNSITISEPGAPKIEGVEPFKADGTTQYKEWFGDKVNFKLTASTNNNGPITKVERCDTTSDYCVNYEEISDYNSTGEKVTATSLNTPQSGSTATTCYRVTNNSGKSATRCGTANVDIYNPTCTSNSADSGWSAGNVLITGKCTDKESGCFAGTVSKTITTKGQSYNSPGSVKDNVGHQTVCPTVLTKIDNIKPVCKVTVKSNNDAAKYNGWYNINTGTPTVELSATDNESGISGTSKVSKNVTEGKNKKYEATFTDKAGNSVTCSTTVSYDKTRPTCSVSSSPNGKNGWFTRSPAYFKINGMPSDVNTWYWTADGGFVSSTYKYSNTKPSNLSDLHVEAEGRRTVSINMTDEAGNTGSCSGNINIDKTPPTLMARSCRICKYASTGNAMVYKLQTVASDNLSGMAETKYKYCYENGYASGRTELCSTYDLNTSFRQWANTPSALGNLHLRGSGKTKWNFTMCDNAGNCRDVNNVRASASNGCGSYSGPNGAADSHSCSNGYTTINGGETLNTLQ